MPAQRHQEPLTPMTKEGNETIRSAIHDPDRRGILIPAGQLEGSGLSVGDRFTLKKGQRDLFTVALVKHAAGEIFFDRSGIFIERTRRIVDDLTPTATTPHLLAMNGSDHVEPMPELSRLLAAADAALPGASPAPD
jgi:hypothetical protein